ncbi:MAG: right-handed parallel beta-helix repeat-containing protein [Bacteroidetes bacterium]|nr:right-handed parallel beta-helix repeat-containing protein [Bacteroidota bacterium]
MKNQNLEMLSSCSKRNSSKSLIGNKFAIIKKLTLLLAVFSLGFLQTLIAQPTTVIVAPGANGSGNVSPAITTTATILWSRGAYVYTAAEMTAAGNYPINGQKINKIRLDNTVAQGYTAGNGTINIYMKQIAGLAAGVTWATEISGATLVASLTGAAANIPATIGWIDFPLSTPFTWSSSSNLEVMIEFNKPSAATGFGSWRAALAPSGTTSAYATGNATPPVTLSASSINRPNMQFDFINAGNCNPVITPGTSVAFPSSTISTPVCPNSAVVLSLSGISVGDLQTYTWQYSSDGVTGWTNLYGVPQNNFIYTANPTEIQAPSGSLYYRCEIICNGGLAVYSTPVQTFVRPWLNAGTYTIDAATPTGGSNFQTFTAAAAAIACGINGPVVFDVLPLNGTGVYTEQVEFSATSNTSATNTITINGNGNKITFNATVATAPWTFMLSGTDWVRVNNLQMESQSLTIGLACHLWKQADNNIFTGCTMIAPANTTTSGNTPFSISGVNNSNTTTSPTVGNNNTLDGCTIRSGGIAIAITGTSAAIPSTNQVVKNCTILDCNTVGIQTANTTGLILRNNLIERPNRTALGAFQGIAMNGGTKNALIEQNRIRNPYAQTPSQSANNATGIFVNSTGTLLGETITVQNNLISDFNSNGVINGIQTASGAVNYLNIYHNTIVFNNAAANPGVGADAFGINAQTSCAPGLCNLINNNVYISRPVGVASNVCLRFNTGASGSTAVVSNYNNLFLSSNATGNFYANAVSIGYSTFIGWQAVSRDINSVSYDPAFINPAGYNYTPNSPLMDNMGTNLGVTTDINGIITRSATTPDIGAYEYTPVADAAISWVSPNAPFVIGNQTIVVNIVNNSAFAITTLSLSYSDGVTTVTEPFTGLNIPIAGNQNITFVAPYNFTANATITATILSVNGGADANSSNNTAVKALCTQMSGAYTVNALAAASSTNFQSFTALANQLNCGGISGPVVVTVSPGSGPYNEQIQLSQIIGSSAVNTISINGNGQTIIFNSTNSSLPSTLELNGTDYLTVDNLVVEATGATYALACHLWNQANNNTFTNCTFTVPAGTTLATQVPFSITGSQTSAIVNGDGGNSNTVSNSTLNNGANGYNLYGSTTVGLTTGNKVLNCLIKDFNVNGIISFNSTNSEFTGNTIERPTRVGAASLPKGVILAAGTQSATVSYNKIRNLFGGAVGTAQGYGIQTTVNPAIGFENRIINNLIYQFASNHQIYGIDINVGGNAKIYHNTIVFDDLTSTSTQQTYGIFVGASGGACDIKNNNIYINRGGNGVKQCLSFGSTPACDFNNLINLSPSGTNYIGFVSPTGYTSLAAWKAAFPTYDQNSKSVDPLFLNPLAGDYTPQNGALNNTATPVGVTTDINAAPRSLTTPDIGAYEFTPVNFDAAISWVSPVSPGILGSNSVVVAITNNQSTVITDLVLAYNDGGADVTQTFSGLNITNGNTQQFTFTTPYTIASAVTLNARIVSANGGADGNSLNDATSYSICLGISGTFTIDAGQPASSSNFISFTSAIASLSCGISGPVVFNVVAASGPYNEQVVIPQIAGSSAVNTLTINGNGNTLTFAATVGNPNTLTLTGADYTLINNLTIIGTNASAAIACHLWNIADNNSFTNCTFTVPMGNSTSNAAFAISGSLTSITAAGPAGSFNVLDGCNFNNGGSNVSFVGNAAPNLAVGNVVKNSTLRDFFQYGVVLNNQDATLVSKTTFHDLIKRFQVLLRVYVLREVL